MRLLLRIIHGIGLAYWIVLSAGSLHSLAVGTVIAGPVQAVMYSGMLAVLLFIVYCASWHFNGCFFRTALISYLLWVVFFVWYGFFGPVAPYIQGPGYWPATFWQEWGHRAV